MQPPSSSVPPTRTQLVVTAIFRSMVVLLLGGSLQHCRLSHPLHRLEPRSTLCPILPQLRNRSTAISEVISAGFAVTSLPTEDLARLRILMVALRSTPYLECGDLSPLFRDGTFDTDLLRDLLKQQTPFQKCESYDKS
jgi:hypothetical protein